LDTTIADTLKRYDDTSKVDATKDVITI